ncbi:hypothetical protein PR048_016201 [Dryococelus australis]|uniref:Uncharacterized protein n=1 Tax=Dryococelus australis TaxID=614101 RepID=A0ABQ9HJ32_9NEOP|nr:hypothetical protein PR048_016201 [Dryococelus australis]
MRVKRSEHGAATECKDGGNGRSLRKPADQRHRPLVRSIAIVGFGIFRQRETTVRLACVYVDKVCVRVCDERDIDRLVVKWQPTMVMTLDTFCLRKIPVECMSNHTHVAIDPSLNFIPFSPLHAGTHGHSRGDSISRPTGDPHVANNTSCLACKYALGRHWAARKLLSHRPYTNSMYVNSVHMYRSMTCSSMERTYAHTEHTSDCIPYGEEPAAKQTHACSVAYVLGTVTPGRSFMCVFNENAKTVGPTHLQQEAQEVDRAVVTGMEFDGGVDKTVVTPEYPVSPSADLMTNAVVGHRDDIGNWGRCTDVFAKEANGLSKRVIRKSMQLYKRSEAERSPIISIKSKEKLLTSDGKRHLIAKDCKSFGIVVMFIVSSSHTICLRRSSHIQFPIRHIFTARHIWPVIKVWLGNFWCDDCWTDIGFVKIISGVDGTSIGNPVDTNQLTATVSTSRCSFNAGARGISICEMHSPESGSLVGGMAGTQVNCSTQKFLALPGGQLHDTIKCMDGRLRQIILGRADYRAGSPHKDINLLLASHQGEPDSMPGRFTLDFHVWESCWTMMMVGGSSRGYPVFPPFHSGAALYSPRFTLISSRDSDIKSRGANSSHRHTGSRPLGSSREGSAGLVTAGEHVAPPDHSPMSQGVQSWTRTPHPVTEPQRHIHYWGCVPAVECKDGAKMGMPRQNRPAKGNVRHASDSRKSGCSRRESDPVRLWWQASSLNHFTTTASWYGWSSDAMANSNGLTGDGLALRLGVTVASRNTVETKAVRGGALSSWNNSSCGGVRKRQAYWLKDFANVPMKSSPSETKARSIPNDHPLPFCIAPCSLHRSKGAIRATLTHTHLTLHRSYAQACSISVDALYCANKILLFPESTHSASTPCSSRCVTIHIPLKRSRLNGDLGRAAVCQQYLHSQGVEWASMLFAECSISSCVPCIRAFLYHLATTACYGNIPQVYWFGSFGDRYQYQDKDSPATLVVEVAKDVVTENQSFNVATQKRLQMDTGMTKDTQIDGMHTLPSTVGTLLGSISGLFLATFAYFIFPTAHMNILFALKLVILVSVEATVAERLAHSPSTKAIRVQSPAGSLCIFASGNRAGRCRWVLSVISRFPQSFILTLLHTHLNHQLRLSRRRYNQKTGQPTSRHDTCAVVEASVLRSPKTSQRKRASELAIPKTTMPTAVNELSDTDINDIQHEQDFFDTPTASEFWNTPIASGWTEDAWSPNECRTQQRVLDLYCGPLVRLLGLYCRQLCSERKALSYSIDYAVLDQPECTPSTVFSLRGSSCSSFVVVVGCTWITRAKLTPPWLERGSIVPRSAVSCRCCLNSDERDLITQHVRIRVSFGCDLFGGVISAGIRDYFLFVRFKNLTDSVIAFTKRSVVKCDVLTPELEPMATTAEKNLGETEEAILRACQRSKLGLYGEDMEVSLGQKARVRLEQYWNERAEEKGNTRENPPTSGIVRHDSHLRISAVTRPGIEPGSPWWQNVLSKSIHCRLFHCRAPLVTSTPGLVALNYPCLPPRSALSTTAEDRRFSNQGDDVTARWSGRRDATRAAVFWEAQEYKQSHRGSKLGQQREYLSHMLTRPRRCCERRQREPSHVNLAARQSTSGNYNAVVSVRQDLVDGCHQ